MLMVKEGEFSGGIILQEGEFSHKSLSLYKVFGPVSDSKVVEYKGAHTLGKKHQWLKKLLQHIYFTTLLRTILFFCCCAISLTFHASWKIIVIY